MATKLYPIKGTKNDDTLSGNVYDAVGDVMSGNDGNDYIEGFAGNDTISGDAGNDTILGGEGNDIVYGNAGRNHIFGDSGDDIIFSTSHDTIGGGSGNDTLVLSGDIAKYFKGDFDAFKNSDYQTSFVPPQTMNELGNNYVSFSVEKWSKNEIITFYQDAYIQDIETIRIDATMPFIFSASNFTNGLDISNVPMVNGLNISINPKFTVNPSFCPNPKKPFSGDITGTLGNDTITGANQTDYLSGEKGADILIGGKGQDFLYGGMNFGWDLSTATAYLDKTFSDTFKYMSVDDSTVKLPDYIMDFDPTLDSIDLSAIDANGKIKGDQAFVFIGTNAFSKDATGQVRIDSTPNYQDSVIPNQPCFTLYGSTNADSKPEFAIKLVSLTDIPALLSASSFVL